MQLTAKEANLLLQCVDLRLDQIKHSGKKEINELQALWNKVSKEANY
jgi:hypothetical protein